MGSEHPAAGGSREVRPDSRQGKTGRAVKIAIGYALAAALWIYASDALLEEFVTDPQLLGRIQTWKGFLFIAVTALVLFSLLRSYLPTETGEHAPETIMSGALRMPRILIPVVVFLIFAGAIAIGGYLIANRIEDKIGNAAHEQLTAIGELKAREIEQWLAERGSDARILADDQRFIERASRRLARSRPGGLDEASILARMNTLQQAMGYRGIYLFDRNGRQVLTAGSGQTFGNHFQAHIHKVMVSGSMHLNDLHWHKDREGGHLEMGIVAPLIREGKAPEAIGAVYLSVDPNKRLYPMLGRWPTPSRSAETLIFRREGDEIVFLNELRHRKHTALGIRFPVATRNLPAAKAVSGKTGLVEGNDYRGVPVITYIAKVQETPWFLVAKVDKEEVFAPVQRQKILVAILAALFTVTLGAVIFFWWRQQQTLLQAAWYRSELERRSLAARLDNLTRHANDIILLLDDQMKIVDANERAIETYGYERDRFLSFTLRDVRAPEAARDLPEHWRQAGTPEGARFETVHLRSDGRTFPVEVSSRTIEIGDKTFKQSIIRDISDRKLAEEELRLSERNFRALSEQFHTLLDAIPDSIFLLDHDYRIIWANAAVAREYGADPSGLQGTFCFAGRNIRPAPCGDCPASRSFESCQPESGIITTRNKRVVDLRTVPLLTSDGRVRGVIEIARDITAHRETEEQLLHAQKMEAIGTLAGGIAHDFNNLLTSIIGFGSLLQMKIADDDPKKKDVDHILTAADRAAALTRSLLAYSRKESLELKLLDVNEIVTTVERFLSRIIGEDVELTVIPSATPLTFLGDRGEIEQVLMNLATNARDSMPGGGSMMIGVKEAEIDESFIATYGYGAAGRFALITVSDTGSGMEESVRERIFEPFFTTKDLGRGTGLGLAIVYGIVNQHRGFINVFSEPGTGSTFHVYLPLAEGVPGRELPAARLSGLGRGETILLVEDSAEIRQFLRDLLTGSGYRVLEAADGVEAVDRFREHRDTIGLLVMDVIMPRKNGKQAFDEIRTLKPSVKALFMSGYTADVINRKGIDTEGLELVSKPFTPGSLLAKIRELLDRGMGTGDRGSGPGE